MDDAINQSSTNLERALDLALLGFEAGSIKRLVLMSDGNATEGDVWRVVPQLRAAGVRVYTIPAKVRASPLAGSSRSSRRRTCIATSR